MTEKPKCRACGGRGRLMVPAKMTEATSVECGFCGGTANARCEHKNTRFEPKGWPTGEDLEVCKDCGMSRTHWEQGESPWTMVEDIEAARAEIEGFLVDMTVKPLAPNSQPVMQWMNSPPTVENLNGRPEEFFWVRGGNFNRPIMVRANNGVNSEIVDGTRKFRSELNFMFYAANAPELIWSSDLHKWPGLGQLEWAGPVARPADDE